MSNNPSSIPNQEKVSESKNVSNEVIHQQNDPNFRGAPNPNVPFNAIPPVPIQTSSASLYIGDLDPSVTEAMLFELFNMVGPVSSIRVCRDAVTRKSLTYAYVNFMNAADGERALETLNYTLIKGKPCRIMWSQRDPGLRKTGSGNIFIKNLDPSIDHKALHDTFSAFGNILSCKVATDDGNSKGYGFVHFENHEAAENAIKNVNGMMLNDRIVYVAHHVARKERVSKAEEIKNNFTNIFIKNLDSSVTTKDLEELFSKYSAITSVSISEDEEGKSKGFGFVNLENHESAQKAVDELNDKEFKGTQIYVGRAQKKGEREEGLKKQFEQLKLEKISKFANTNLFVKNLDDTIVNTDDKLREFFEPFGTIVSCKLMKDEKELSKGFGFVCFEAPEEANKAVLEMNGKMLGGKPIYVAVAQRKEDRRSQLEAQASQRAQTRIPPPHGMHMGFGNVYANPMFFQNNQYLAQQRAAGMGGYGGQPQNIMGQRPRFNHNQVHPGMPPNSNQPHLGMGQNPNHMGRPFGNFPPNKMPPPSGPRTGAPDLKTILSSLPEEQRKQHLGERIYAQISQTHPEHAPKVTGMLLEMQIDQLMPLLENPILLNEKASEAVQILKSMN